MDVSYMEPMLPEITPELEALVLTLVMEANHFAAMLNPTLKRTVGDLVRSMNCYYSNLIEGHSTELADIQRAMESNYSNEPKKRNLQLEARAHIEVQRLIDHGQMPFSATSRNGICWIHEQFYRHMPEELLWVENREKSDRVKLIPGHLRERHVRVGTHEAPPPEAVSPMLDRFAEAYSGPMVRAIAKLVAIGASHHRMVWIHPFLDGNGRVSRLMSHALFRELKIGSELWSVSRGLARNVEDYKSLLQRADMPRQGSRDGRGNLSASGLAAFTEFFLTTALDQVRFMQDLIQPTEILRRVEIWANEEISSGRLMPGSWPLLREVILVGEFQRGQAGQLTQYSDRQARTILSKLTKRKLLVSDTEKGPVRLGTPPEVVERWFPGLYVPGVTGARLEKTQRLAPVPPAGASQDPSFN